MVAERLVTAYTAYVTYAAYVAYAGATKGTLGIRRGKFGDGKAGSEEKRREFHFNVKLVSV